MRLYFFRLLVVAAVGIMFGTITSESIGQENYDVSFNSTYADRLAALEAEIATLKNGSINVGGSGCGCAEYDCGCGCPSTYFGYEATILRPYMSSANFPGAGNVFDNEYGWGHRFILGYDTGDGIGARLRYWMFNHGNTTNPPPPLNSINIDMDALDAEVTLNEQMRNWDILVTGGVRYARAEFTDLGGILGAGAGANTYFEGYGPTVSLEATRDVGRFYVVGDWRSSLLFGDIRGTLLGTIDDETAIVIEQQLGMGWVSESGVLNVRGVWETQAWLNDTFADDANGLGSNLTLSGFTVSATLSY